MDSTRHPRAKVLNVNDRAASRYLISQMLKNSGFDVVEAETGQEALDRALEQPDVIVLDVKLPDIDGYTVSRKLKLHPETNSIPIVLSSAAFVGVDHRVEGLDSGADAYLVQPFEAPELSATIRALLRARAAEKRALEALRLRDDFLSTASHELRTPLTAVSLQAESLQALWQDGRWATVPPTSITKKLDILNRQSQHLGDLIDLLLDVSRLRAGHLTLNPEILDLADLTRRTIEELSVGLQKLNCPIHVDANEPVVGVWDRLRMEQVVSNLITNACKYGQGRPVIVSVRSEPHDVAVLCVEDQGRGISKEDQGRIFERFERASPDRNQPGFGLGLWIVRQILQASDGTIAVESEPGQGARFTVRVRRHGTPLQSGNDSGNNGVAA